MDDVRKVQNHQSSTLHFMAVFEEGDLVPPQKVSRSTSDRTGDMCADFDNLYDELDQNLTDGQHPVGSSLLPSPHPTPERDEPMVEPAWNPNDILAEGASIEELVLRYVQFNGQHGAQTRCRTYGELRPGTWT